MTTLELNKYAQYHAEVDEQVDAALKGYRGSDESVILDSRLAWFFVPEAFKVRLVVDPGIAGERVFCASRKAEEAYETVEHAVEAVVERRRLETERYKATYGIDQSNPRNYDLVIDTSFVSPSEVVDLIEARMRDWNVGREYAHLWVSPAVLFPTVNIRCRKDSRAEALASAMKEQGYDEAKPVSCLHVDSYFFVFDGHHRVVAANWAKLSLLPATLVAHQDELVPGGVTAEEYVMTNSSLSQAYDWEEFSGSRHPSYPSILTAR